MRISDWSSDVCSSDLIDLGENCVKAPPPDTGGGFTQPAQSALLRMGLFGQQGFEQRALLVVDQDMNIVGNTDIGGVHRLTSHALDYGNAWNDDTDRKSTRLNSSH